MQAITAHLAVPRPSRNRDFGRDSRRQGCVTGPLSVHTARQRRQTLLGMGRARAGAARGAANRPILVSWYMWCTTTVVRANRTVYCTALWYNLRITIR